MYAIEAENLVKQYRNGVRALDNFNIRVKSGEIFSLLGPNGAGKSTLINILTTLYKPTSGKVSVLGRDLCKEPGWIRTQIACAAQNVAIDEHLSLLENMLFQSRLYRVGKAAAESRIQHLIESFRLSQYLKYPVASYSGGIKRRLDIAMNMVSCPRILFLDEPTVGMDVISRKAMWEIMKKIRDEFNTTIFLTTHYLEEADELSNTICIMKEGHELVQDTPSNLKQYTGHNLIRISFSDTEKAKNYTKTLSELNMLSSLCIRENSIYADTREYASEKLETFENVNRWLLNHKIPFEAVEVVQPDLEDIFIKLTAAEE